MKREAGFKNYYEEYLEVCRSISPKNELLALRKLIKEDKTFNDFRLPLGICLLDYSNGSYVYMSDYSQEIIGHSRENYVSGGVAFHNSIWLPEDRIVFEQQLFHDIREFWSCIPSQEIQKYRFSFCYRYYRNDGTISHFLQHTNYQEPQYGQPILNLSMFSDIGDYKTDNNMVLTVSHLVNGVGYVKVFSKSYSPQSKPVLSVRESEVLRLSSEGLSSKMIADKLFISLNTVKNHKANMMEKTSAKNIAELINLSLKNKWV